MAVHPLTQPDDLTPEEYEQLAHRPGSFIPRRVSYNFTLTSTRPKQFLTHNRTSVNVTLANGQTVTVPRPPNTMWCDIHGGLREAGTECMYCTDPAAQNTPQFRVTDTRTYTLCEICGIYLGIEKHRYGCGQLSGLDLLFSERCA